MQAEPTKSAQQGTPWPRPHEDVDRAYEAIEAYADAHGHERHMRGEFEREIFIALAGMAMECETVEHACARVSGLMDLLTLDERDRVQCLVQRELQEHRNAR